MSTINLINFTYYPIQWPQREIFVIDLPEKHKLVTNALTIRFYSMLLVKKQKYQGDILITSLSLGFISELIAKLRLNSKSPTHPL